MKHSLKHRSANVGIENVLFLRNGNIVTVHRLEILMSQREKSRWGWIFVAHGETKAQMSKLGPFIKDIMPVACMFHYLKISDHTVQNCCKE